MLSDLIAPDLEHKDIGQFKAAVRAAVRKLWIGAGDLFDFFEDMDRAITFHFNAAWNEGANQCGIRPDERTPEEEQRLTALITQNRQYIYGFGEAVQEGSKANGGLLGPQMSRAEMWINRYNEVRSIALQMACADVKLRWQWSPEVEQHCEDCRKLNGRVYRASVWAKYGIRPQSTELACHGYRCGCSFIVTTDPLTPGRPPAIRGKEYIRPVGFEVVDLGNGFARLDLIYAPKRELINI